MKYRIKPKRDFPNRGRGFYDRGRWINRGFVVTDGICNIMPGATWFETIPEAMQGLRILCEVGHDSGLFWKRLREERANQVAAWEGRRASSV